MTIEIETIEEIHAALDGIASLMTNKGIVNPRPKIEFKQDGRINCWLFAMGDIGGERYVRFDGDNATDVLADMLAHVVALKSEEDWRVKLWRKDVAKVIDDGHDLNLPDNVMAPLRALSQAMTENLLTVDDVSKPKGKAPKVHHPKSEAPKAFRRNKGPEWLVK